MNKYLQVLRELESIMQSGEIKNNLNRIKELSIICLEGQENGIKELQKSNKLEFIKNVLDINVDSFKQVNTYTIKAMYNDIDEEGYRTIKFKLVDEFSLTWDEIEKDGGISQVNKDLKECYGV